MGRTFSRKIVTFFIVFLVFAAIAVVILVTENTSSPNNGRVVVTKDSSKDPGAQGNAGPGVGRNVSDGTSDGRVNSTSYGPVCNPDFQDCFWPGGVE